MTKPATLPDSHIDCPNRAEQPEPLLHPGIGRKIAYCAIWMGRRFVAFEQTCLNDTEYEQLKAWLPLAEAWLRDAESGGGHA